MNLQAKEPQPLSLRCHVVRGATCLRSQRKARATKQQKGDLLINKDLWSMKLNFHANTIWIDHGYGLLSSTIVANHATSNNDW